MTAAAQPVPPSSKLPRIFAEHLMLQAELLSALEKYVRKPKPTKERERVRR